MNNVIIVIFGSIPKKLVETTPDVLGFIALWPPAYYKGRGSKDLALCRLVSPRRSGRFPAEPYPPWRQWHYTTYMPLA